MGYAFRVQSPNECMQKFVSRNNDPMVVVPALVLGLSGALSDGLSVQQQPAADEGSEQGLLLPAFWDAAACHTEWAQIVFSGPHSPQPVTPADTQQMVAAAQQAHSALARQRGGLQDPLHSWQQQSEPCSSAALNALQGLIVAVGLPAGVVGAAQERGLATDLEAFRIFKEDLKSAYARGGDDAVAAAQPQQEALVGAANETWHSYMGMSRS